MADLAAEISKLKSTVFGNGSKGHEQRIESLEQESKDASCPTGKAFTQYLKELQERKGFRKSDISNWIAAAALIYLVVKDFIS